MILERLTKVWEDDQLNSQEEVGGERKEKVEWIDRRRRSGKIRLFEIRGKKVRKNQNKQQK